MVKLLKLRKSIVNQRGFSLLEVVLSLAITGILVAGIGSAICQTLNANAMDVSRMTAVKGIENAVNSISRDGLQAQEVDINAEDYFLKLTWVEWKDSSTHVVSYSIKDDGTLQRSEIINNATPVITLVSQNIDPVMSSCSYTGNNILNVTLTITAGGSKPATETRDFQINTRTSRSN